MGEQRTRNRIVSKIDQLPNEIKQKVNAMLLDLNYTYNDIAIWLNEEGFEISKSSVGRYAIRNNEVTRRLMEAQEQTKALIEAVKNNPEADYTEGALQIMSGELTRKIATAQEEWDEMTVDKAAKIMVSLSRTRTYKDKIRQDMQAKVDLAFEGMEKEIMEVIKTDEEMVVSLKSIMEKARKKMKDAE